MALLRGICLGLFALLVLLTGLQSWLTVSEQGAASYLVYVVKLLPLLAFAPFLWRNDKRAWAWFSFVLCVYFLEPVVDLFAGQHPVLNGLLIADIILLFSAAMVFIRRYRSPA